MSQIILATFEDGVLKPDSPLELAPSTRVRLVLEPLSESASEPEEAAVGAWSELERLWDELDIDSGGSPPSRDQLHDRY
jgi:predicted DNA-binding antitoxin AbrB/MazE fold protein